MHILAEKITTIKTQPFQEKRGWGCSRDYFHKYRRNQVLGPSFPGLPGSELMMMETLPWPSRGVRPRTTPLQEWVKILMGGERTAQHTRKGDFGRQWRARGPCVAALPPPLEFCTLLGIPGGRRPQLNLFRGGGEVIDDDNLIKICLKTFLAPCGRRFCNFLLNFRPPPEKCRPQ